MKVRAGFVSNSSSASFIIPRRYLSEYQVERLRNYKNGDDWCILITDKSVVGDTYMDNGAMQEFLDSINIDRKYIEWEDNS